MNKKNLSPSQETLKGINFHRSGNFEEAKHWYEEAIQKNPDEYESWHLLGVLAAQDHQIDEAIKLINKSLLINHNNLDALNNLGLIFFERQNFENAIECFDKIIYLNNQYIDAWFNKGNALQGLLKFEEAISCYDQAIAINSKWDQAFNNKGNALQGLLKFEEAISCYDQAIALNIFYEDAYYNKGVSLQNLKKFSDAIYNYRKVISLNANNVDSFNNLGDIYLEINDEVQANLEYSKAISIDPNHIAAQMGIVACTIPRIQNSNQNTICIRNSFVKKLEELRESVNNASHFIDINIIGTHHPFLLAYHDHNNKMLMQKYGQIYQKLIEPFQKNLIQQRSASIPNGKINLGIISNHFFNHSVWSAITKGLVFNLDRSRFNLHLFSTNSRSDNETIMAKNCATSFSIHSTPQGLAASILDKKIEALIFPEIGMDKLTIQIASLNLAPIQIVSWGHPETTGIPSINYFLGGELFENKHSSDNYSELLLSLPNLGCYLEPYVGPIEEVNLIELGINPRAPKLLCPGAPFKYHPDYDWVLVEISKQNPSAQFIFFEFPNSGVELLRTRLANRFNTEGLHQNINSLKFIPILDGPHFRGLMKQMTLYLDTIGFSGFNTALQAIESDLPIITREGHFMRGNLAAGLLKRVKMPYLVAKDNASYIKLVTDLIANPQLLKEYSKLISLNRSALYHDLMPIRELEKFLLDKCRPHGIELNEY